MSISVKVTRPIAVRGFESLSGVEDESILDIVSGDEHLELTALELQNEAISLMVITNKGLVRLMPKNSQEFLNRDLWFHSIKRMDGSSGSLGKFWKAKAKNKNLKQQGWVWFPVDRLHTFNQGAVIVGPDGYKISIKWGK
jgi:hypothetical protein